MGFALQRVDRRDLHPTATNEALSLTNMEGDSVERWKR